MKKTSLNFMILFCLFVSCKEVKKANSNLQIQENEIEQLLNFFNVNAYQAELGTYYSEVDNEGKVMSGKVFNVALSRLIYGLSYSSEVIPSNLKNAQRATDFQLQKLVDEDSVGTHFISFFDLQTNTADSSLNLDIWQQAYGLCGLSELYRKSPNDDLLAQIHTLHDSFIKRFYDDKKGGFYANYENNEQVSGSKT
ncbi:MAG: hypothetical protein AAGC85_23850, partial [Bacteroidota bacterium]